VRIWITVAITTSLALSGCKSREEVLQAAEAEGKLLAEKKARLAKGVGEAMKGEGAAAAESLSEGAGTVLNSVGRGLEKGLDTVEISAGADLAEQKIKIERAARHREGGTPAVKAYLVTEAAFKGTLQLIARDKDGKEVGRARTGVDEAEAVGKYIVFEFDKLVDLNQASSYQISSVASAVTAAP
jgi:outer membrane murein-binding lipoprotein Lpp